MKARTLLVVLATGALLAVCAVGAWAATSKRTGPSAVPSSGPLTATRYSLTQDGNELGPFSQLTGLESGAEAAEYTTTGAGSGGQILKTLLPGNRKPPSVVLARPMTSNLGLATWHQAVLAGNASARRTVALTAYSADGKPVARYHLTNAWPAKLQITGVRTGSSEALIETVTLVAEQIQRVSP